MDDKSNAIVPKLDKNDWYCRNLYFRATRAERAALYKRALRSLRVFVAAYGLRRQIEDEDFSPRETSEAAPIYSDCGLSTERDRTTVEALGTLKVLSGEYLPFDDETLAECLLGDGGFLDAPNVPLETARGDAPIDATEVCAFERLANPALRDGSPAVFLKSCLERIPVEIKGFATTRQIAAAINGVAEKYASAIDSYCLDR